MMATPKNYYELLGVHLESTEKEILRAYRRKALSCHPDKNPDNPKAGELFIEISDAVKVLTDKSARAAFDKVLKAKEAAKLRTKAFDAKRKKFKEDLEKRETDAQQEKENDVTAAERLAAEITRLREEGSRLLKEQQELIEKQLAEERENNVLITPKLKVKWKASKHDHQNGGYNEDILMELFQKYGHVTGIVLSRKNGMAIVEYEKSSHADMALEFEKGLEENPVLITWLECLAPNTAKPAAPTSTSVPPEHIQEAASSISDKDFENIVLMKMRQAEERKRLTQQLLEQDKKDEMDKSSANT